MTDGRLVAIAGIQLHSFFELVWESIPAGVVYGDPGFEIKKNHAPAPTRCIVDTPLPWRRGDPWINQSNLSLFCCHQRVEIGLSPSVDFGFLTVLPQLEQSCEVYWGGTAITVLPYTFPKDSNQWANCDQAASLIDLASLWFLTIFRTWRSS